MIEIFKGDTTLGFLSTVKISDLYVIPIKSSEALNSSKMSFFSYIGDLIKPKRLKIFQQKLYDIYKSLRYMSTENFSSICQAVREISLH